MFVPKHYIQLWWGRGGKHENNGVEDDDGEVDDVEDDDVEDDDGEVDGK